jgi:hypothetical protein
MVLCCSQSSWQHPARQPGSQAASAAAGRTWDVTSRRTGTIAPLAEVKCTTRPARQLVGGGTDWQLYTQEGCARELGRRKAGCIAAASRMHPPAYSRSSEGATGWHLDPALVELGVGHRHNVRQLHLLQRLGRPAQQLAQRRAGVADAAAVVDHQQRCLLARQAHLQPEEALGGAACAQRGRSGGGDGRCWQGRGELAT